MKRLRGQMVMVDLRAPAIFFKNLMFVYHLTTASEQLIRVAMADLQLGSTLRAFFHSKLIEEKDHSKWLGEDLTKCGYHFKPLDQAAVAMAGSQYYLIFHLGPASLLGYMAALECFPAPMAVIEMLEQLHGKDALTTVRYHAEHDVGHSKELLTFIDSRPDEEHSSIWVAATIAMEWLIKASISFSLEPTCDILLPVA